MVGAFQVDPVSVIQGLTVISVFKNGEVGTADKELMCIRKGGHSRDAAVMSFQVVTRRWLPTLDGGKLFLRNAFHVERSGQYEALRLSNENVALF
jgi:hypothetical protein